jgi:hypothetical protein
MLAYRAAMFVSDAAREIDRLVVGGHAAVGRHPARASMLADLPAQPGLLNSLAIVLLRGPVTRTDVGLVMGYTPPALVDFLLEDNRTGGWLDAGDDGVRLTDAGRDIAMKTVELQEEVIADLWSGADGAVRTAGELAATVVAHASQLEVGSPGVFRLFTAAADRPTASARTLRLLTALRYWRADAHRRALADVELLPRAAHALNVIWDRHRDVTRLGQGGPEVSQKGLADLEARGLAADGAITGTGIALREEIERETDRHTEPAYAPLDESARATFLAALTALPG